MVHVVIDRYFSLFLKGLKIFLNPRLSLIAPLIFLEMLCLLVTISIIERIKCIGYMYLISYRTELIMSRCYSYFQNIYSFFIINKKY